MNNPGDYDSHGSKSYIQVTLAQMVCLIYCVMTLFFIDQFAFFLYFYYLLSVFYCLLK